MSKKIYKRKCKKCDQMLMFVETDKGKAMPLNADKVMIAVLDYDGNYIERYVEGYVPHWATCPSSDSFRKSKQESLPL